LVFLFSSFVLTVLTILILRPWAKRIELFDYPSARKNHTTPTLLIGGLAVITVLVVKLTFMAFYGYTISHSPKLWAFILTLVAVVLIGLMDDYFVLSFKVLILLQLITISIMVVLNSMPFTSLGELLWPGELSLGMFTYSFIVICYVGMMNAINMSDGTDGLAGSLAMIALIWIGLMAFIEARPIQESLTMILAGGLLAFLMFNARFPWNKKAQIFLGSAGSMSLGFILTWSALNMTQGDKASVYPISMVYIFAIPLMDMFCVMLDRMRRNISPLKADRSHLHHKLMDLGFSPNKIILFQCVAAFIFGGVGFAGWYLAVPEYLMFYGFLAILAMYCYLTIYAWDSIKTILHVDIDTSDRLPQ